MFGWRERRVNACGTIRPVTVYFDEALGRIVFALLLDGLRTRTLFRVDIGGRLVC